MQLKYFLLVAIVFLAVILCFAIYERTGFVSKSRSQYNLLNTKENKGLRLRISYLAFFAVFAYFAIWTVQTYIYPEDENIFRNVDYHVLSHKGYELGEKFYLAHGYTTDYEGYPENSLWDGKDGVVLLDRSDSCIHIQEFTDPIYIKKDVPGGLFSKDSHTYHLSNLVINEDVSQGFSLESDNQIVYTLDIEPAEDNQYWYISTVYKHNPDTCIIDTSTFTRPIQQGYPILDIIARSPRIVISTDMEEWFNGAYLVREEIPMEGNTPSFDPDKPSRLCLMPGASFYQEDNLTINGEHYDFSKTFDLLFDDYAQNGKVIFFSGIGHNRTEDFQLSMLPANRMRLEFLKPDMKQIKDSLGQVFISSSIEEISKEELKGGYFYNKFVNENNHNHINAHFQYQAGNARTELYFNVFDLYGVSDGTLQKYACNSEFLLHSKDKTPNAISWIFEVTDLRATNNLQSQDITWFILVMFLMVSLRVLSDNFLKTYSLSLTELAIYIILFCLCVVRLILGWRASTFVPVEDISFPMYLKMRQSVLDWTLWLVACSPAIISIFVCVWKSKYWKSLSLGKGIQDFFNNPWHCLISFFFALLFCFVAGHAASSLNRLCNIPLPIVLFFICEIWMIRLWEKEIKDIFWCLGLASAALFIYLFVDDAGFTIIFLAYIIVHYLVLCAIYYRKKNHRNQENRKFLSAWGAIFAALLFVILLFEGEIMIFAFRNVGVIASVICAILLVLSLYYYFTKKQWIYSPIANCIVRYASLPILSIALVFCLLDATQVYPKMTTTLNEKIHMRYRAEVQQLKGDEKIDDLIKDHDFDSKDIIFIMRSAHNQWFINQYLRAGQKLEDSDAFFHIQPHSNQGATYTTQTTDLVVTRYLLAEHGEWVVRLVLVLWVALIIIFVLEFKISSRTNQLFMNGPILLFVISLMVYLSATNRIVFVGQDFPLISIQSKVAVIFPLLLLMILLGRSIYLRGKDGNYDSPETGSNIGNGFWFAGILILFTSCCLSGIEQKGKDQQDSQFNVSRLISDLTIKVDDINNRFAAFQTDNRKSLMHKTAKEIWSEFSAKENSYNSVYFEYLKSPDFFGSLLRYFEQKQTSQTGVDQFLHLRRRGGTCYLALNKQHYFIPAIMKEESEWTGNIYASRMDSKMMLFENTDNELCIEPHKNYEMNALKASIRNKVPNMPLQYFSEEWTLDSIPLFLIHSTQGQSNSEYFNIKSDSLNLLGDPTHNQIATAVLSGDVLSLYLKNAARRNVEMVNEGKMTADDTPYLVKNMWINGHKRLFYPLGKQCMWTYNLGNLVSEVYSKNPALKDTSIYLSLDYNLCKTLNKHVMDEIGSAKKPKISNDAWSQLSDFSQKTTVQQQDRKESLYYDAHENKLITKSANKDLQKAVLLVNKQLKKNEHLENCLSKALQVVLETTYDFTAVALDGDGHIRALYDYSKNRRLDPNNISHFNKVISELYQEGTNADERDIFGSKALQYIPVGPGSSFKPIAYTAITSQKKLAWESIDVTEIGKEESKVAQTKAQIIKTGSEVIPYAHYGGVDTKESKNLFIDGEPISHDRYLEKSNNLYHSIIILLGMQRADEATSVMRTYSPSIKAEDAFPVFTYNGSRMCFDPSKWYRTPFIHEGDMMTEGLYKNYRIEAVAPRLSSPSILLFGGDSLITNLYSKGNSSRSWVFPEKSSINNADRNINPLRTGFNQPLLGADPIQMTPLQMAVNASRLASLNRADTLATILDGVVKNKSYRFFDFGSINSGWSENDFLSFMKRQVWSQLRKVPKTGTATGLSYLAQRMEKGAYGKPYYLYCKTGTLNDDRPNAKKKDRMKHLLVIVTDKPLESVNNVEELKKVRYYSVYLSYIGIYIDKSEGEQFNTQKFGQYIEDVLNSESFKNYMNK